MTRVLVLRAREDAERTAEKLRAMGCKPLLFPVIEIAATGAAKPPGAYDAVLASSAKGLELADNASALQALPLHVVGARTAQAAQQLGWRPDLVAGHAAALLPPLLARYATAARFLYLAGRDRQGDLETGLREAGHEVEIVETYEAREAHALSDEAKAAITAGAIDVALHYSRRSAEIFLSLAQAAGLDERLRGMTHFALSENVAEPLAGVGLPVSVAQTPDEASLLTSLGARPLDREPSGSQ